MRGKFLRGVDDGAGNDPDAATCTAQQPQGSVGDEVGSVQADAGGPHFHHWTTGNYGFDAPLSSSALLEFRCRPRRACR